MAEGINMAGKLWDIANLVTGFAIVQSLALTYSLANHTIKMSDTPSHMFAFIGTLIFTTGYIVAIRICGSKGRRLDSETNADAWRTVTTGRVITVCGFTLLTLATIFIHWRTPLP
jgi:hypothetical protein